MFYIDSRDGYARENHWDLHRKHLALENFWWEKHADLVKIVGGNRIYVCAGPVLAITAYDCFGE